MLPKALIDLLIQIFQGLLAIVGAVAVIGILIAALTSFVDGMAARSKIVKICGVTITAVSSAFIVYTLVTLVAPHFNPMDYFNKLFIKETYSPINMITMPTQISSWFSSW